MINKNIFREYDIRGIYNEELNDQDAYQIGLAFGTKLFKMNKKKTIVGFDNRLSSKSLYNSLIKGICEASVDVINIGLCLTPMVSVASDLFQTNCYIMITASHNPKEYNGFKFSYNGKYSESGDSVKELYEMIVKQKCHINTNSLGNVEEKDITSQYTNLLLDGLHLGNRKLKIVCDPGNGTTSNFVNNIFDRLNMEVIYLNNISDGTFPNHHPDPSVIENMNSLSRQVTECQADLGIAFDGDGDRVGVVDEKGQMIDIDKYMIIIWRDIYNKVKNKKGLLDIKCSRALEDEMLKLKIEPIYCRTGASYTQRKVLEGNIPFGGELSGHIYFTDRFGGYVDGIYAALRLIEILSNTNQTVSMLLDGASKYYSTKEIKIKVDDLLKFKIIEQFCHIVKDNSNYKVVTIDGVKIVDDDSFALVRASNTGPTITMRFEAKDKEKLLQIQNKYELLIKNIIKETNYHIN